MKKIIDEAARNGVIGADFFLVTALVIFLLVFIVAIVYAFTLNKKDTSYLLNLPLEINNNDNHEQKN
jgi:cbb3-type cytochrome oxidase subunit 3